jgi:hypothetical protein
MPRAAVVEFERAQAERGSDLLKAATSLRQQALDILREARAAGNLTTALQGVREAARLLKLEGRFRGEITDDVTLNVLLAPVATDLIQVVLEAVRKHPQARADILAALQQDRSAKLLEHEP